MAHRPPATFAMITANGRLSGESELRSALAELSPHDNLVYRHTDQPGSWRVRTARGWQAPEAPPKVREVVVIAEPGGIGSPGWVEQLLEIFVDSGIAAVAPRTNLSGGDDLFVPLPYRPHEQPVRERFLAEFGIRSEETFSVAESLDGAALAVRAEVLEAFGGIDAVLRQPISYAQLCSAARAEGRVVVAERAFLHQARPSVRRDAEGPLVSACLIVKNEEQNLPRCLDSLSGFVDEVIVYDTGSTDSTVAIAEAAGARVIGGYWDDDFARARNAALQHCRHEWVLWLDADEALTCDAKQLRRYLRSLGSEIEGHLVTIDNLRGTEASTTLSHPACRLFRRSTGHWDGRVHEQLVARAGTRDLALEPTDRCRITHWGYVQGAVSGKDKGARNLRTAFGDLAGGSDLDLGERLTSLGRSYLMAHRLEEGIEITRAAITVCVNPSTERLARRALIEGLLAAERAEEALGECELLRDRQSVTTLADAHGGAALLALGRYEEALEYFERVHESIDDDGFRYDESFVAAQRAEALSKLGRHDAAATLLLGTLQNHGGLDAHLGLLAESLLGAGRSLDELVRAIPADRTRAFVPQLLQLQPTSADAILNTWAEFEPDNAAVLAAGARIATSLPIARQLVWSARLRQHGLAPSCPLVICATDTGVDPLTRVLAAGAAALAFGDARAELAFSAAVLGCNPRDRSALGESLVELNESLAERAEQLLSAEPIERLETRVETGRSVLIVCRHALSLRAYCLAVALVAQGERVTLLQPQPAAPAEELLARFGITVAGWREGDDWTRDALSFVAHFYEERRYDAVLLTADAAEIAERVAALVPVADVQVDRSDDEEADATLRAALRLITGNLPPVPWSARSGVAVIGNRRSSDGPRLVGPLQSILSDVSEPIAVIGDDPGHELSVTLPAAIDVGPVAQLAPWLRAVRAVLIEDGPERSILAALAEYCGAPAHVVGDEMDGTAEFLATLAPLHVPDTAPEGRLLSLSESSIVQFRETPQQRSSDANGRLRVLLRGGIYGHDSLATVNRELVTRLAADDSMDLAVESTEVGPFPADSVAALGDVPVPISQPSADFDLEIRHAFPPNFLPSTRPLVLIQPWEFGGFPAEWIGPIRDVVDELWVPTSFVRDCAVGSGIAPEKVFVVPNGVDVERFSPGGAVYPLRTKKSVRLLFVGGLIERKGVDALLETYCASFTAADDVCLVIKPFGSKTVYRNSTLEPTVRRLAAGNGPEIEIVDEDLTAMEMAALYRSADVLVHPYRGEGFGLPIAEAMACGRPVIVPDRGASVDFCDETVGWLVRAREVPIEPSEWTPSAGRSWWLEPSRESLAAALREAVASPHERSRRGSAARTRIVEGFSWDAAAAIAHARLSSLAAMNSPQIETPISDEGVQAA